MDEDIQMLNPSQVAEILGVHQKTVHLWLRSGKLQGIKISYRAWRIPRSSLDSFIADGSNARLKQQTEQLQQKGKELTRPSHSRKLKEENREEKGIRDTSAQSKMKYYIRDIMGEQTQEE